MFPQQCKLIGSSAQISSGVCGSRFRRVSGCAGAGSGGMFREVPEGSGACWCSGRFLRFRGQVPEGSGVLV